MRGFLEAGKNSLGDARIPQGWQELPGDFLEETRIHREGLPSGPKLPEGRGELPKGSQRCPREAGIHWERQGFLGRGMNALGGQGSPRRGKDPLWGGRDSLGKAWLPWKRERHCCSPGVGPKACEKKSPPNHALPPFDLNGGPLGVPWGSPGLAGMSPKACEKRNPPNHALPPATFDH